MKCSALANSFVEQQPREYLLSSSHCLAVYVVPFQCCKYHCACPSSALFSCLTLLLPACCMTRPAIGFFAKLLSTFVLSYNIVQWCRRNECLCRFAAAGTCAGWYSSVSSTPTPMAVPDILTQFFWYTRFVMCPHQLNNPSDLNWEYSQLKWENLMGNQNYEDEQSYAITAVSVHFSKLF